MRRYLLMLAASIALVCAGVAAAAIVTRTITLPSGACVTLSKTRVCAARARVKTVQGPITTIVPPAVTITLSPPTVTVTVSTPSPTPTTPSGSGSRVILDFSGNGDLTEAPFTTAVGETLSWTWQNTNGDFPTGMSINDASQLDFLVDADGSTTSGSTYLSPGTHTLEIVTVGNWTIHVG